MSSKTAYKTVRVGTRRSALAKAQTQWVINQILKFHPQINVEIVEVVTTGDKILNSSLNLVPGKGVFVKEIEDKLLTGEIDLAVHSMKDMPTEMADGLVMGAVTERVDPRDVLVSNLNKNIEELPQRAKIGTSSLRRKAQLLFFRPDLQVVDIRGNIDTRLKKSESHEYDGILLAAAGLHRMGWQNRIQQYLSCDIMVPAVGQGALGIEIRKDDASTQGLIQPLNEKITELAVQAERVFLEGMGGGCQTPMGAFCRVRNKEVIFHACVADEDGKNVFKVRYDGSLDDAMSFGEQAVQNLKDNLDMKGQS